MNFDYKTTWESEVAQEKIESLKTENRMIELTNLKICKLLTDQAVRQNNEILKLNALLDEKNSKIIELSNLLEKQEEILQNVLDHKEKTILMISTRLHAQMRRLNQRKVEIESDFKNFTKLLAEKDEKIGHLEKSQKDLVKSVSNVFIQMSKLSGISEKCDATFRNKHLLRPGKVDEIMFESNSDTLLKIFTDISGKAFSERISSLWQSGFIDCQHKKLASTASLIVGDIVFSFDAKLSGHIKLRLHKLKDSNLQWLNGKIIHFNAGNRTKRTVSA